MPPKYSGILSDVIFVNLETGEQIEMQSLNASISYSEQPSEPIYINGTKITSVLGARESTLHLEDAEFTMYGMAVMFGFENHPEVKKLLRLEKKTAKSKRRIRNKVRKKIRTLLFLLSEDR
jgi:hypothetical protein